ncbi:MAG: putative sugar nucleotidyl transferase [Conexivisphaerales archaeon]
MTELADVALFEEDRTNPLRPLALAKPTFKLIYSYRPLGTRIRRELGRLTALYVPRRFEMLLKETESETAVNPSKLDGEALLVNSRLRPEEGVVSIVKSLKDRQYVISDGAVAAARTARVPDDLGKLADGGLAQQLKAAGGEELGKDGLLLQGPWDLITSLSGGLTGTGVVYGSHVAVEEPAYFDTSHGPVLIADDAKIEAFSRIVGPALIGKGSVIHSARINGNCYIGDSCRVGGEVEESVLQGHSNKTHSGYLGHSYVGEWVNIGAGAVTSDLKNTYGSIRTETQKGKVDTGLMKLGSFMADLSKVSINSTIYAGKCVGMASQVHGLVDRDVPPFTIYGRSLGWKDEELRLESGLETFRRMKARRNMKVSRGEEQLVRLAYEDSREGRARLGFG